MGRSTAFGIPASLVLFSALAAARQDSDVAPVAADPDRGLVDQVLLDKLALLDPAVDTWEAERWNALVREHLESIEVAWAGDELPAALAGASWIGPELEAPALWRAEAPALREGGGWTVTRARGSAASAPPAGDFAQALASWRAQFDRDARLECEVFAVPSFEDGALTEIRLTAAGAVGESRVQHNARWSARWRPAREGIQLVGLTVDSFEAAAYAPHTDGPFADASASILGTAGPLHDQLAAGLVHWRGVIPATLEPGFLGHQGIALGDVNGDGLEDLYLCQPGGLPNKLLLRRAEGGVEDVSAAAGVDLLDHSSSTLLVDFDEDADCDLVVSTGSGLVFFENDGRARFERRLMIERSLATSLAVADFDEDSDLDLYVCSYVSPYDRQGLPVPYHDANNGEANLLLRNGGDWTFVDVADEVGMGAGNRRFTFAAAWEDYDNDGDQDLYVANDFGRNNLYRNDGGTFVDVAAEMEGEDVSAGMGVTWGDADGDGWMDVYITNMYAASGSRIASHPDYRPESTDETAAFFRRHCRGNTLYSSQEGRAFVDATESSGTAFGGWAWGALFLDFDNDGQLDLFSPNGFVTGERRDDL